MIYAKFAKSAGAIFGDIATNRAAIITNFSTHTETVEPVYKPGDYADPELVAEGHLGKSL